MIFIVFTFLTYKNDIAKVVNNQQLAILLLQKNHFN